MLLGYKTGFVRPGHKYAVNQCNFVQSMQTGYHLHENLLIIMQQHYAFLDRKMVLAIQYVLTKLFKLRSCKLGSIIYDNLIWNAHSGRGSFR